MVLGWNVCLGQPNHLWNCTLFQAQVHCAKIALKNMNRHLSSRPYSHVPSFLSYVDCITVKKIFSRVLKQIVYTDIFFVFHKHTTYSHASQFQLHFTSLISSAHAINAALLVTTTTILAPLHHVSRINCCIYLWVWDSTATIASGRVCLSVSPTL